jgi:hypothetical protein
MKKRFVTSVFAIGFALMLSLSGCGEGTGDSKADYELYAVAAAAMNEAAGIEMDMDMTTSVEGDAAGFDSDLKMTSNLKMFKKSDTDFEMEMRQTTNVLGTAVDTTSYFKDGNMYINMGEEKMKMALPMEDAIAQANASAMEFEQSAIKNSSSKDVDNGKEVSFTVSGDALKDYMEKGTQGALAGLGTGLDMSFGDATITSVIDSDGNMVSLSMKMTFDMSADGEKTAMTISIDMHNIVIGDIVIDFPADLDSYEEIAV